VCEYWQGTGRWVKADAQLDEFQRNRLGISFDPLDVPNDQFLVAGKAWQMCRAGEADPDAFGISELHGLWFVRGNLVRDLASLNKVELLPWDSWGLIGKAENELIESDLGLLDQVALMNQAGNDRFDDIRSIYESNTCLRVPRIIVSYLKTGVRTVEIET
jgi:hypothetical protein